MPDGHGHHHVCAAPDLIQKDLVARAKQITRVIYGALRTPDDEGISQESVGADRFLALGNRLGTALRHHSSRRHWPMAGPEPQSNRSWAIVLLHILAGGDLHGCRGISGLA